MLFNNHDNQKKKDTFRFLYLCKLLAFSQCHQKGYTFAVATVLGLVTISATAMALVHARSEQTNTIGDEASKQAQSLAEGAITHYTNLINENPEIATYCANSSDDAPCDTGHTWSNITASILDSSGLESCSSVQTTSSSTVTNIQNSASTSSWQNLGSGGEYRLISYTYEPDNPGAGLNKAPGIGTLIVEGRKKVMNDAGTQIRVTIPIINSLVPFEVPGVWVKDTTNNPDPMQITNQQSFNADIRQECSVPDAAQGADQTALAGYPSIMNIYDGSTPSVEKTEQKMPNVPEIPTGATAYPIPALGLSDCWVELPRTGGIHTNCTGLAGTFNGVTDTPDSNGRYHYIFNSNSGTSIKLSNSAILINPPNSNEKAIFYLKGSIYSVSGTNPNGSGTSLSCTNGSATPVTTFINQGNPNKLEMYGADGVATWSNGLKALEIKDLDTSIINAFVHFPEATADLSQSEINGAIWVKKFKSSHDGLGGTSGCSVGIIQKDVGNKLLVFSSSSNTNQLKPLSSWQRIRRSLNVSN